MKHRIDPTVDCVFKALLGDPAHPEILIDFLNSMLRYPDPIVSVTILNPYNAAEFVGDHQTIVDVKARDLQERIYQIEIQLSLYTGLLERVLYTWADTYQDQLKSGGAFRDLRPVVSLWMLGGTLIKGSPHWHHRFSACDPALGVTLSPHFAIHTIELKKWRSREGEQDGEDRWIRFFREAERWEDLPDTLDTPVMRQAMDVLKRFSEKEEEYHRYQARQNYLRQQADLEAEREKALAELASARVEQEHANAEKDRAVAEKDHAVAEKDHAVAEKDHAVAEKDRATAEAERLRNLLRSLGVNPE